MRVGMCVCMHASTRVCMLHMHEGCWPPQQKGTVPVGRVSGESCRQAEVQGGRELVELGTFEHFLVLGKHHLPPRVCHVMGHVKGSVDDNVTTFGWNLSLTMKPLREAFYEQVLLKEGEIWVNRSPARPLGMVRGGWSLAGGGQGDS